MRDYLSGLPPYAVLIFRRLDFWLGGLFALVLFFSADQIHIGKHQLSHHRNEVTLVIVILAFVESGYRIYCEQRDMRAELAERVRVDARLISLGYTYPSPGTDETLMTVRVEWDIWADREVDTDKLALNLIYVYDKRWYQVWKKARFPQTGIRRRGERTVGYRKKITTNMDMPVSDSAVFDHLTKRGEDKTAHWLLELVLITGMPKAEYRIPVFIDPDTQKTRGAFPPL